MQNHTTHKHTHTAHGARVPAGGVWFDDDDVATSAKTSGPTWPGDRGETDDDEDADDDNDGPFGPGGPSSPPRMVSVPGKEASGTATSS